MDLDPYSKVNDQSFWTLNKQEHFYRGGEGFHQRRKRPCLESTGNQCGHFNRLTERRYYGLNCIPFSKFMCWVIDP